jgi:hypothetical protein
MGRTGIVTEWTTGTAGAGGETAAWTYNGEENWDGQSRLVIALHGHGTPGLDSQGALQFAQNPTVGTVPMALARTGRYIVCSIQAAGAAAWSKPAALTAINAAVTAARTRGAKTGKYGLLGYSMGGLTAANQLKRDAANIAAVWTWAPAIDIDFAYSTGGHSPIANNGTWTTEINTAFGSYAATAGYRVWDEPATYAALTVPWRIAHATDDSVVPYSISSTFVAAVNTSYVTLRSPAITGDHTNLFAQVPDDEVVRFFDSATWN